ncbi:MAG: GNAT family N-acetyltransferase [Ideonella sp.]|nr:GNAT family N-acetyltransferase [Ideonella sp.]
MTIRLEPADQPEVLALIDALDAYQKPLYPAESHHGIDVRALSQPEVLFAVVRDEAGAAMACGAVVLGAQWGEVKRMFVQPAWRGQGVSQRLLDFLQTEAIARECRQLMLETGILQPEALGLYERAGFVRRGPFGDYAEDPLSVFMQKDLAPT